MGVCVLLEELTLPSVLAQVVTSPELRLDAENNLAVFSDPTQLHPR